ncbi:MAG: aldose 1-epimerase family protein [Clostridia bacterium]|nr:aldose 1-epimerase family protein [Clostridia bacterium]
MIILNNGTLEVEIEKIGAEIRKVTKDGVDRMWSGDPSYWAGVAPLLFPIVSALPDDKFTYNGKEYEMQKHGFIRKLPFEVEATADDTATFMFASNEETLKVFPWKFELRIKYTLIRDKIKVEYFVLNKSDDTMYYSIGSHEGYACPDGIENYDIVFEKEEVLKHNLLDGMLLSGETVPVLTSGNVLPLNEKYFEIDALIFKNIQSRKASLVSRITGQTTTVHFPDCEYLLLWHAVGGPFMCIEPWWGICSTKGDSNDITKKEGIIALESKVEKTHCHIIEFR